MYILSILLGITRALLLFPLLFSLRIITTVFLPVTVAVRHVSRLVSFFFYLPFALLSRLEAVYIFCGTAAIIGVLTGALLGLTTHVFTGAFGLRDESKVEITSYAPSTISSTSSRHVSKKRVLSSTPKKPTFGQQQSHPPTSRMLSPPAIPTILEEEDEDSPFLPGDHIRRRSRKGSLNVLWVGASDDSSAPSSPP